MKIVKAPRNKYKSPKLWFQLVDLVPVIKLSFLNNIILNSKLLTRVIDCIPNSCPFNKAYELQIGNKLFLLYYCPPLCHLNPFYPWIVELKVNSLLRKSTTNSKLEN